MFDSIEVWFDGELSSHIFDVYEFNSEFPFLIALGKPVEKVVYIFAKRRAAHLWTALYVGETERDLRTRLMEHVATGKLQDPDRRQEVTHIHVKNMSESSAATRRAVEQRLIECHRPPWNVD